MFISSESGWRKQKPQYFSTLIGLFRWYKKIIFISILVKRGILNQLYTR